MQSNCDHEFTDDGMFNVVCVKCQRAVDLNPERVMALEDALDTIKGASDMAGQYMTLAQNVAINAMQAFKPNHIIIRNVIKEKLVEKDNYCDQPQGHPSRCGCYQKFGDR